MLTRVFACADRLAEPLAGSPLARNDFYPPPPIRCSSNPILIGQRAHRRRVKCQPDASAFADRGLSGKNLRMRSNEGWLHTLDPLEPLI